MIFVSCSSDSTAIRSLRRYPTAVFIRKVIVYTDRPIRIPVLVFNSLHHQRGTSIGIDDIICTFPEFLDANRSPTYRDTGRKLDPARLTKAWVRAFWVQSTKAFKEKNSVTVFPRATISFKDISHLRSQCPRLHVGK